VTTLDIYSTFMVLEQAVKQYSRLNTPVEK
jgi:hypothetical protein